MVPYWYFSNINVYQNYTITPNVFKNISLGCTPRKDSGIISGNLLGPDLNSFQRREAESIKYLPFIECSRKGTKDRIVAFINRWTDGLIGINE